ncbi:acyl-CoA dehydrogenase family protein [Rhodococcus tukisamuensis]|uniref:Acyl-CoA dehydrogenase n=1 Tax=Rhodococcus tukisamuensis TaxID=168276 RepID=A0A1G6YB01_9NOCA|nr:acyl-CoA dehydrogenase family protein [Rhodococcus tukisamuensis]SDD86907.1 Acyl-CoA dehydrogenase [Rhodococcus tukisamuensis]
MTNWQKLAQDIADDVLFPAADSVDADGEIPVSHFEVLADAGFYAMAAPPERGGPALELDDLVAVVETLCGGCLATSFTWLQHHGVVAGLAGSPNQILRERHWDGLLDGTVRAGVAFAGAIPQPPLLYARRVEGGYLLDGVAPFVTGWGIVDLLQLSARDEFDDSIVHTLVEAVPAAGITVEDLPLIAARGSNTVRVRFDGYEVSDDRVVNVASPEQFRAGQTFGSWLNACMATGVTRRCLTELAELGCDTTVLTDELSGVRANLDTALAGRGDLYAARAQASELALRAAAALVTATGSAAALSGSTAERLMREATLTLVAASRPQIRRTLLDRLGGAAGN